ncbi:hypothetical protein O6H91_Y078600 [Diphasiastrum complanatum]|nr:hypothetical protein O6H91_Y078600 [Diphasiastrum complanatum]
MVVQEKMGAGVELLSARAKHLKDSLSKSQAITDNMINILGSFDHRLSSLEAAMRPTQVRTHAFRTAHQNINDTLKAAEAILTQFDVSRQVESKIIQGPHEDIGGYLTAVDQLQSNVEFFSYNRSFKSSDGALNHSRSLLAKAMTKLEEEFKQVLTQHSKLVEPARLLDSLPISAKSTMNSSGTQGDGSMVMGDTNKNEIANNSDPNARVGEGTAPTLPILIPPRIVPQLREMAQHLIGAGHHQQCLKIYRYTFFCHLCIHYRT